MNMKTKLIYLIILLLLVSCNKSDESCPYKLYEDPELFISFEINGLALKYSQCPGGGSGMTMDYNYSNILYYSEHRIAFRELNSDQDTSGSHPAELLFRNYTITGKAEYYLFPDLSEVIKLNYPYACPPWNPALKDTVLMNGAGVVIRISDQKEEEIYSTDQVVKHYNYNPDSITTFFSDGSYFRLDDIEQVCNDLYLVTGSFETILMDNHVQEGEIYIRNGRFAFLTQ